MGGSLNDVKSTQTNICRNCQSTCEYRKPFRGNHSVKKEHWVIDAKSLLGVLALSLQPGQTLELNSKGGSSSDVIAAFLSLGLFEEA